MADIIFVAKLDSRELKRDLKNLGKDIPKVGIPLELNTEIIGEELKAKLQEIGAEPIGISLDDNADELIERIKRQFKNEEFELNFTPNEKDLKQLKSDIQEVQPEVEVKIGFDDDQVDKLVNRIADRVDEKIRSRQRKPKIEIDADVDTTKAEKQIKELIKPRRLTVQVEPISNFPKIEARGKEDDLKYMAQLSRNPKAKVSKEIFPGIEARAGVSANDGFKAGIVVTDAPTVIFTIKDGVQDIVNAILSQKDQLTKSLAKVIQFPGNNTKPPTPTSPAVNISNATGGAIGDVSSGFFQAVGYQLFQAASTQALPSIGRKINSQLNKYTTTADAIARFPAFNTPRFVVDEVNKTTETQTAGVRKVANFLESFGTAGTSASSSPVADSLNNKSEGALSPKAKPISYDQFGKAQYENKDTRNVVQKANTKLDDFLKGYDQKVQNVSQKLPAPLSKGIQETADLRVARSRKYNEYFNSIDATKAKAYQDLNAQQQTQKTSLSSTAQPQVNKEASKLDNQSIGTATGNAVGRELSSLNDIITNNTDRIVDAINPKENPIAKLFKAGFNLAIRPFTRLAGAFKDQVAFQAASPFAKGLVDRIQGGTGLDFTTLGTISGSKTIKKFSNLGEKLGITEGEEDFKKYLQELQTFLEETQGEGNLFAASTKRYKENFAKIAAQAKAEVEQEYAEQGEGYLEGKQLTEGTKGVILGSHGFSGHGGEGSYRQAAAMQEIFPEHAIVPIENKDTDIKRDNPVQFFSSAIGKTLRKQLKGYNQDAVDAYKEMLKIQLANPDLAEDLDFVFSGYSAGGMVGTDFAALARSQNQKNVRSFSFASPVLTNAEQDPEKDLNLMGELDPLKVLTKLPKVKNATYQETKAGLGHDLNNYILHPEFQEVLTKFVEGESRTLSEDQNERLYKDILPKSKTDVDFKSSRFKQVSEEAKKTVQQKVQQKKEIDASVKTESQIESAVPPVVLEATTKSVVDEEQEKKTKANRAEFQQTSSLLSGIIQQINEATESVVNEFRQARLVYEEKEAEIQEAFKDRALKLAEELQENKLKPSTQLAIESVSNVPDLNIELPPHGQYLPKGAVGEKKDYVQQAQTNRDKFKDALKQIQKTNPGTSQIAKLEELIKLIDKESQNIQIELGKNIDKETRQYLERYGANKPLRTKVETQLEKAKRITSLANKAQEKTSDPTPRKTEDITVFNANKQLQQALEANEQVKETAKKRYGFQKPKQEEPKEKEPEFVFREEDLPDIAWSVPSLLQNLQSGFQQTVDSVTGKLIASTQNSTTNLFQTVTDTFKKFLENIGNNFVLDSSQFNTSATSATNEVQAQAQEEIKDPLSHAHEFIANEVARRSTGQDIDQASIPKLITQEEYTKLAGKRASTTHDEGGLYDPAHNVVILGETYRKAIEEGESNKHYKKAIKTLAHENRHAQQYQLGDRTSAFFKEEYFSSKASEDEIRAASPIALRSPNALQQLKLGHRIKGSAGSDLPAFGKALEEDAYVFEDEEGDDIVNKLKANKAANRVGAVQANESIPQSSKALPGNFIGNLIQEIVKVIKDFFSGVMSMFRGGGRPKSTEEIIRNHQKIAAKDSATSVVSSVSSKNNVPTVASPKSIRVQEFIANEVNRESQGKDIDPEKIPHLITQSQFLKLIELDGADPSRFDEAGAGYLPTLNAIYLNEPLLDAINQGKSHPKHEYAISALVHENRHAQQYKLGDEETVTQILGASPDIDDAGIKKLIGVEQLQPTDEERKRLQKGIDISVGINGKGHNFKKAREEDAYTFQDRFSGSITQKYLQEEQDKKSILNQPLTKESGSEELQKMIFEEEKKRNQPKSLKALPGNIFGAFFEELDEFAKTATQQFKAGIKGGFSDLIETLPGRFGKNTGKFAVSFVNALVDVIESPDIEDAVENALKAAFSPDQFLRELTSKKRSKQEIAAESVAFINEELNKVGQEKFALEPDKVKVLGAGVHSTVLGTSDADTRDLAYKTHPNLYESSVMQDLQSKGVGSVPKVHYVDENVMVSEKIKGKDLQSVLKMFVKDKENNNIEDLYELSRNLGSGLKQFHEAGYVHTDLHNQNMLVQPDLKPKFIDLEFARQTDDKNFKELERNNVIRRIEDVLRVGEGFQGNKGTEYIDKVKSEFLNAYEGSNTDEPVKPRPRTAINDFIDSVSEVGVRGKVDEITNASGKKIFNLLGQGLPPQLIEELQKLITGFYKGFSTSLTKLLKLVQSEFDKRTEGIKEEASKKIDEYIPAVVKKDIKQKQSEKIEQKKQQIAKYVEQGTSPLKVAVAQSIGFTQPYTSAFVAGHEQASEQAALGVKRPGVLDDLIKPIAEPIGNFTREQTLSAATKFISKDSADELVKSIDPVIDNLEQFGIKIDKGSNSIEYLFNILSKLGNIITPQDAALNAPGLIKNVQFLKTELDTRNKEFEEKQADPENKGKYIDVIDYINKRYIENHSQEIEDKVSKFPAEKQEEARQKLKEGMSNNGLIELVGQVPTLRGLVIEGARKQKTQNLQAAVEEIKKQTQENQQEKGQKRKSTQASEAEVKVYTVGGFTGEGGTAGNELAELVKIATNYDPKVDVKPFENPHSDFGGESVKQMISGVMVEVNKDSLNLFKEIYATHLENPAQRQVVISHSGGGYNAQDVAEMAAIAGIPLETAGIGTPNLNAVRRLKENRYKSMALVNDPTVQMAHDVGVLAGVKPKADATFKGATHAAEEFFGRRDSNEAVLKLIYGQEKKQDKNRLGIGLYRGTLDTKHMVKESVKQSHESLALADKNFNENENTPEQIAEWRESFIAYLDGLLEQVNKEISKFPEEVQSSVLSEAQQITDLKTGLQEKWSLDDVISETKNYIQANIQNINQTLELASDDNMSSEIQEWRESFLAFINETIKGITDEIAELPTEAKDLLTKEAEPIKQIKDRLQADWSMEDGQQPQPSYSVPDSTQSNKHQNAITEINRVLQASPNLQLQPEATKLLGKGSQGSVFGTTGQDKRKLAYKFVEQQEADTLKGLQNLSFVPKLIDFKDSLLVHEQVIGNTLAEVANNLDRETLSNTIVKNAAMLRQVHDAGYTHGDFHSENIMLDEENNPKLIDFGKSRKVSQNPADAEEEVFEDYIGGLAGQKLSFNQRLSPEKIEELFEQGYNNSENLQIQPTALPAVSRSVPSQSTPQSIQLKTYQQQLQSFLASNEKRTTIKTPEITAYIRKKEQEIEGKIRQVLELVTVEVPANLQGKGVFKDFFNQLQEINPYEATTVSTVVNPNLYDSLDRKGFSLQSEQEASFYKLKDQNQQAGIKPQTLRDKFFPPQDQSMDDFFASLRANRSVPVEPYGEILKSKFKSVGKKAVELVNQIGIETSKANNNLNNYFSEKVGQAKQFADGVKEKVSQKVSQSVKVATPAMQAVALDLGEKAGQVLKKPEKPFLVSAQEKIKSKIDELIKQSEEFLFPTNTPSYQQIFPSTTEKLGQFLGKTKNQTGEAIASTIPQGADQISRSASTSFVSRIPFVGKFASQVYGNVAQSVADTSRLFASNYDADTQAGIGIGRAIKQDKLPGKLYGGIENLSPALADISVAGVSGIAALKTPVQNLLSDVIKLRGNLDFGETLTNFQSDWVSSFKKVSTSVQVGKDLEKPQKPGFANPTALVSRLTLGLPGVIQRTASKFNINTRLSEIPAMAKEAIQFTNQGDKVGATLDNIRFQAKAVGTAFKLGFNGIHKPLELLEETGNRVFDGLGTNVKQFALGFLSFQAIQVGIGYLKTAGIEAVKAYAEFDKLKTVLNFTQGGEEGGKEALGFVRQQAKEKKIPLLSSIKGFSQLSASTRGSTISNEEVKDITKGVLSASTVLSLSSDDQAGAITALSQMASKGKASSEELRQQLGERIPGAMGIAARSMAMSEQQFTKALESGLIPASELLPKLGRQLEIEFGGAAKTASNNVVSSMYGVQNSMQELQITLGGTLAPVAQAALNVFSFGLDFVNDKLKNTDGTLTRMIVSGGFTLLSSALGMFTASIGSISLLNVAIMGLSTALGFIGRVALPFLAQFMAVNAVLTTMSTLWSGITDKGGDMAKFADDAAERLKKIEQAASGANKELNEIANKKYSNVFDEFGHTLQGTLSGGKDSGAYGKRALSSGGVIAGGAGLSGGFAAFQLAGGMAAGIPALIASIPIAIASAVGAIAGGVIGYGLNRAVMAVRTGGEDSSYYGWGELKRDKRRVAAGEAGENIDKLLDKGKQYIGTDLQSEKDPITGKRKLAARGDLAAIKEIDKQISAESKLQAARPDTDIEGKKQGQEKLKKLNIERAEKSKELTEFQTQLAATIMQLKEQIANEEDPQIKQMLEVRLANAQKFKDQMDSLNSADADPLIKFANAINQVGIALEEAERKSRNFLTAQNLIAKQVEVEGFGTDQFSGQKSALATAKNQYTSTQQEINDREKAQGELREQLENPELQGILKSRGITKETTIGELKSKLKEEESKSGAQKDSKYEAILQAQVQYKEEEDKVNERRLQLADAGLQVKQAQEAVTLAEIDEKTKNRQTKNETRAASKNEAITKAVGSGKLREGAASNARAENELQGANEQVVDIEAQLADLKANKDKISAREYIQRERDLGKQLIEARTRVAEKSNDIEKNRLDNQMNDIKNYYSDVKTITEGQVASGAITPEEGAKKSLDIIDSQSKEQLAAIAAERERIGNKNPELTRKLDVKEAEVHKQQQEALKNYSQERQGQINTKYDAERAKDERALSDGKKTFEDFSESRLQSTIKNADEIDQVLAEQRKRTPPKNKQALDEIAKQEAENHKKRLEGYKQYFDELTQLNQSKYQALIGIEENRFALGEVGADEFFDKRLKLAEESLDKQEELLTKKRASPLGKDPREKVKIDNEQNEIDKKRLDNLRQFYEERQNLIKSQGEADVSELDASRAEGTVTDETFLDTRLEKQKASSAKEQGVLAERKQSKLGLDPRELAKIQTEEANLRKRDVDNLRAYYDEKDALEKQRTDTSLATLKSQLETGATTAKDYYEKQYQVTLDGIKKQRDVLAQRKTAIGNNPEELRKIEQQEAELNERQSRAAKERYDNLNSLLEQSLTEANNTAKLAETQRIMDAEAIFNKDRTVPKQIALEGERLKAQTDRIDVELENEKKRNEELKKVKFSNPIDEQKRITDVQNSDQKILDLTKQRIDSQISLEDNHKEAIKRSIDEALEARKLSTEQAIALAEQEKNAQDLVIASLDRKGKLLKSKQDLSQAQDALTEFRGQSDVDKYNKALELRRKLNSKDLAPGVKEEAQNQLEKLGFKGTDSELDILNKKHEAEDRLAKIQEETKLKQLKLSQQQAELDNLRNIQLANQAVKQAEINQLQAGGNVINAQKQLNEALTAKVKDPVAIAAAEQAVRISQMQAEASAKQVDDKRQELAATLQIASEQKNILASQAELTREQMAKAEADRKSAQALEKAESLTSNMASAISSIKGGTGDTSFSSIQKRFKGGSVVAGQPYIVGEDPSTGKILPSSEIFVPQVAGRILSARETREILLPKIFKQDILNPVTAKDPSDKTMIQNNNQPVVAALADLKNLIANRKPQLDANFTLVNEVDPTSKVIELQRRMMFSLGV